MTGLPEWLRQRRQVDAMARLNTDPAHRRRGLPGWQAARRTQEAARSTTREETTRP